MRRIYDRLPLAVKLMVAATAAVACAVAAWFLMLALLWGAFHAGIAM